MPYPWRRPPADPKHPPGACWNSIGAHGERLDLTPSHTRTSLDTTGLHTAAGFLDVVQRCQKVGSIDFKVPKFGIPAGSVLTHAQNVLDGIFSKHDPCIFKIGFTHDPEWRWGNNLYGYQRA